MNLLDQGLKNGQLHHKYEKKIEKEPFLIDVENIKHANDKFKNRGLKIWPNAVCRDFR